MEQILPHQIGDPSGYIKYELATLNCTAFRDPPSPIGLLPQKGKADRLPTNNFQCENVSFRVYPRTQMTPYLRRFHSRFLSFQSFQIIIIHAALVVLAGGCQMGA